MFPKLGVVLNYLNINATPLNNRRIIDFFKSAVLQAIEMRDDGDKVIYFFHFIDR
jgi:hypothetical protein